MKNSSSISICLFSCCLLAGCGGGNSTPPPQPVPNAISVTLNPASAPPMDANQNGSFTANVSNDSSNQGVTWTLTCSTTGGICGTLALSKTLSGVANNYAAPATLSAAEIVTIIATSLSDSTKSKSVKVTVNPAFALANPLPAQSRSGAVGQPFSLNLMTFVQGGTPPFTWVITSGTLPAGLMLDAHMGMVTGTPTATATGVIAFNCSDSGNPPTTLPSNLQIPLNINSAGLTITSGGPPKGNVGEVYGGRHILQGNSFTGFPLTATGGTGNYGWHWAAAPGSSLPPGLIINILHFGGTLRPQSVPVISGTPTAAGTYQVVVTVTDGTSAPQASANYTITIGGTSASIAITSATPSSGALNIPYAFTFTASGGSAPYTWMETGMLPPGLIFNNSGLLSGTPTVLGLFPISVIAQDSQGQNTVPTDFSIQILAPGFNPTGSMTTARVSHTATLLNNERVLITGGVDGTTILETAELFNQDAGGFTPTGSMNVARESHTATLLKSGKVLIVGGENETGILSSAELFDPESGNFKLTGSLGTTRKFHTATLLKDGTVLVIGGLGDGALATAELFDPASGIFKAVGSMGTARLFHTATLLSDGKVLVTGGDSGTANVATAELFDPFAETFMPTNSPAIARHFDAALLLKTDKVLDTGGFGTDMPPLKTSELFDPVSETFTSGGDMATARARHTMTLRNDGTVLVAGGVSLIIAPPGCTTRCKNELIPTSKTELFDPISGSFATTRDMSTARETHTSTLLRNGTVLVTGGRDASGAVLATAELYQ